MNIEQRVLDKLAEHGLVEWRYRRNDRLTRTAGRCRYGYNLIELAGWFIDHNTEEEIELTIAHEVAHALTKGHGHDRVWARKCIELGGNGQQYYNMGNRRVQNPNRRRTSNRIYTLKCESCGYTGGRYRRKMTGYLHRGCGGGLLNVELTYLCYNLNSVCTGYMNIR